MGNNQKFTFGGIDVESDQSNHTVLDNRGNGIQTSATKQEEVVLQAQPNIQNPLHMQNPEVTNTQKPLMKNSDSQIRQKNSNKKFILFIGLIAAALVLLVGGVASYFLLGKSDSSGTVQNEKSEKKLAKNIEFMYSRGSGSNLSFKLKDIKRNVKVNKNETRSTVYVFEVENKGKEDERYLDMNGLTKHKAIVDYISDYNLENSTVLEDNKCEASSKTIVEKSKKKTVCYVFPTTINSLIVPQVSDDSSVFKAMEIDNEESEIKGKEKKVGESFESEKNEAGELKVKVDAFKILKDKYKEEVFALPITVNVEKESKYSVYPYIDTLLEIEEGIFIRGSYNEISDSEYGTKRVLEKDSGVKKGDVIKFYETFNAKKAIRVYFITRSYVNGPKQEIYYYNL